MRILSISSDKKIFEAGSSVRKRMQDQSSIVDSLTIVVFSLGKECLEEFVDGKLRVIPTNSSNKFLYILNAYKIGRAIDCDLVTTQDPFESGLSGVFIANKLKKPLQVQCHTDFLSPEFRKDGVLNFIRFFIAHFVLKRAKSIRVVSKRIRDSIERKIKYRGSIEILPVFREFVRPEGGVFPDLHKKYPQFGFIILSVGRIEKEKNLDLLLESFAESLYMMDDAGLVIVGDGKERDHLLRKAEKLGIQDKVKFEGWRNDLILYYSSADLFVSTSKYEGYGLTFLEAAYYGCPILSTDVGIMGEVFNDNVSALICPVGDRECLGNKMAEMRRFADLRKRIAQAGNRAARSVIWSKDNYLLRLKKIWRKSL